MLVRNTGIKAEFPPPSHPLFRAIGFYLMFNPLHPINEVLGGNQVTDFELMPEKYQPERLNIRIIAGREGSDPMLIWILIGLDGSF